MDVWLRSTTATTDTADTADTADTSITAADVHVTVMHVVTAHLKVHLSRLHMLVCLLDLSLRPDDLEALGVVRVLPKF